MGTSPYFLIYRQDPIFPLNVRIPILEFLSGYAEDDDKVRIKLMNLLEMDEKWTVVLEHMAKHQAIMKRWFDKKAMIKSFNFFDLVLLWDKAKEKLGSDTKF